MRLSNLDESEQAYSECRAHFELGLASEIKRIRSLAVEGPNVSDWVFQGVTRDDAVAGELRQAIAAYLQSEIENFSAILLVRGLFGEKARASLRGHLAEILAGLHDQWDTELRRAFVAPDLINDKWPSEGEIWVDFAAGFEQFFWEIEAMPGEAFWPGRFPLDVQPEDEGHYLGAPWYFRLLIVPPKNQNNPDPITLAPQSRYSNRAIVDAEHGRLVALFDAVLQKVNLETWLRENRGISRTSATDYRRGKIAKNISVEKREMIELAIKKSAAELGLANRP